MHVRAWQERGALQTYFTEISLLATWQACANPNEFAADLEHPMHHGSWDLIYSRNLRTCSPDRCWLSELLQ